MNIDSFISQFLGLMYRGVSFCFSTLQKITFMGTNLLAFIITIEVLGVVLGIVLTLVKRESRARGNYARKKRAEKSDKGDGE